MLYCLRYMLTDVPTWSANAMLCTGSHCVRRMQQEQTKQTHLKPTKAGQEDWRGGGHHIDPLEFT